MATDLRSELANIKDFEQLVVFLRDQMGWPIGSEDSFEELTFEYTPEELGIDEKNAAKIQEIKRLRPLTSSQPWGIFFVKFEPKALPVVALRRILSQVTLKKRSSANPSERKSWSEDDLLFISNYGETVERKISLAHFSKPHSNRDLPTLKVLGWDNLDTPLHLDSVVRELTQNLAWPEKEEDIDKWRLSWTGAFKLLHRETITTAKELSVHLAELARTIRDRINTALAIETEHGPLTNLYKAFQKSLIHDLSPQGFADMYAQTITYGLLSARIENPKKKTVEDFGNSLRTNPFLRELMETFLKIGGRGGKDGGPGIDFDELGVSEVVELLDNSNMEAVLRDFGDRNPQEDPVIHFYEHFLAAYDKKQKVSRGVFYTPRPVVSFIVRSVDEMLCKEFGLEDGLADTTTWGEMARIHKNLIIPEAVSPEQDFVQILDPATGTGTFLVEVIDLIYKRLVEKWQSKGFDEEEINDLWNEYVPKHLLTRLHGYELLMAPYAIAHLKIGMKLFETGYRFESDERARVYLTNALEPAQTLSEKFDFAIPLLAHEAEAVNKIKQNKRFTVIIGNPPYSGVSTNNGMWITDLVKNYYFVDGKPLGERNSKWLQDDYVKFIRAGQFMCDTSQIAVLGFITNHGYIDNPTFRGMRQSMLTSLDKMWILDLHGNIKKKEMTVDGSLDENVFDIQQGVAVLIGIRYSGNMSQLWQTDLFGTRSHKYEILKRSSTKSLTWRKVNPVSPFYLFLQQNENLRTEYIGFWSIKEIMPVNVLGFQTHRDHFAISLDQEQMVTRCKVFREQTFKDNEIKIKFNLKDNRDWNLQDARRALRTDSNWMNNIIRCLYRPFDIRWCYFSTVAMDYPRRELQNHVAQKENLCLLVPRQVSALPWRHCAVSDIVAESCLISTKTKEGNYNFPLYLYPKSDNLAMITDKRVNFSELFLKDIARLFEMPQKPPFGVPFDLEPEKIFQYIYAIFHSPAYRTRYAEFLKTDFPRLPLTSDVELFHFLSQLGSELIALHLMKLGTLDLRNVRFLGEDHTVSKVGWTDDNYGTIWIDGNGSSDNFKAGKSGFCPVPEEVWNFHIGGYQVCAKWLKDRKGRKLSEEDIIHYQKIVVAISETLRIMKEIDTVIDKHGGWPGAFEGK